MEESHARCTHHLVRHCAFHAAGRRLPFRPIDELEIDSPLQHFKLQLGGVQFPVGCFADVKWKRAILTGTHIIGIQPPLFRTKAVNQGGLHCAPFRRAPERDFGQIKILHIFGG
jgi:hypothetical protein